MKKKKILAIIGSNTNVYLEIFTGQAVREAPVCERGQTPSIRLIVANRLFRSSSTNLQHGQALVHLVVLGIPRYPTWVKIVDLGCIKCVKINLIVANKHN